MTQAWRNSLLLGDKSRIVCAPPLPQCSHCHVWLAHGAAVYQLIRISPLQLQTSANQCLQKGGAKPTKPGEFQPQIQPHMWLTARSRWSDSTSQWERRVLHGPAVTWPSSHKALPFSPFNPPHPITWQRRPCAHYTPQQRSFTSPYEYHTWYHHSYFCPISICWQGENTAGEDILSGLPSVRLSVLLNASCSSGLSETLSMKTLLGNKEVDFNGYVFMTAVF